MNVKSKFNHTPILDFVEDRKPFLSHTRHGPHIHAHYYASAFQRDAYLSWIWSGTILFVYKSTSNEIKVGRESPQELLLWYPSILTLKKSLNASTVTLRCKTEFELEDIFSIPSYLVSRIFQIED